MDAEEESLAHVRNLVQNFCDKIQLKVISAAAGENSNYSSAPTALTASEQQQQAPHSHEQLAELKFLLNSTKTELNLALERQRQLERRVEVLQTEVNKEVALRKSIHDELMEIKGNIRVFLRLRPSKPQQQQALGESVKLLVETGSVIHIPTERRFEFDACIDPRTTHEAIFENQVAPFITSAMDGRNVTLVAYGQTGSGKTHTMQGTRDNPGVYARSLQRCFELAAARAPRESFTFQVSILQVYNDTVQDLLAETTSTAGAAERLEIHTDERKRVYVKNLTSVAVSSSLDVETLLQTASQRRIVGAHALNEHSSRSHLLLQLDVNGRNKITFIDLAGSERAKDTEATGERFKESQHINKSLSCLGDVLQSLSDKSKSHHPFRNSKLTFLLQDCLGKHCKVAFFACIAPEQACSMDTFCTLAFAERIRKVELGGAAAAAVSSPSSPIKQQGRGA